METIARSEKLAAAYARWADARSELAAATRPAPESEPATDGTINVLIVDDEARNLVALESILESPRYRLVRAMSGEEALLAVMEKEFACIVLDVQMPGMTGFEVAQLLRERRKTATVPIIFLTAYYNEDRHELEGYAAGAVDYLHKPFNPLVLRKKVDVFAGLHRVTKDIQAEAAHRERLARSEAGRAAAIEAQMRAEFLAEASRLLSVSLDIAETVAAALDIAVPMLGVQALFIPGSDLTGASIEMRPVAQLDAAQAIQAELRDALDRAMADGNFRLSSCGERTAAICPLIGGRAGALVVLGPPGSFDEARVALMREVSGRAGIALENARLHAAVREADQRKSELLAMLAHELRNPLAPLRSAAYIMGDRATPMATLDRARAVMLRQVDHMARLIGGLLDASSLLHRKVVLSLDTVSLSSVMRQAVESSSAQVQQAGQSIAVALPEQPIAIRVDEVRLVQALSNVLDNASRFSGPGTMISIRASIVDGHVRLSVKDQGRGISADFLPRAFDLFTQDDQGLDRPDGGLGIGLALVKAVVELHGGRVAAYSDGPGKGTEIVIDLPVEDDAGP